MSIYPPAMAFITGRVSGGFFEIFLYPSLPVLFFRIYAIFASGSFVFMQLSPYTT